MAIQRQLPLTNSGYNLNVTKQPCHSRDQQRVSLLLSQCKQDKNLRWRTNDKKTNILVKAIA